MRAFIDTSTLVKKYRDEEGSEEFAGLLEKITDIVVSPTCWIEINSAISRLGREEKLTIEQAKWIETEIKRDFNFFSKVAWDENLESKAVELAGEFFLKTLDAIQLASGLLSRADMFLASDMKLYREAEKVLKKVRFIG